MSAWQATGSASLSNGGRGINFNPLAASWLRMVSGSRSEANIHEKERFSPLLQSSGIYGQTLVTLPERRQREHTLTVLCVPFMTALTFLMFGFQARLVLRLEWETFKPKVTPFPHTSHFAILTPPIYTNYTFYRLTELYYHISSKKSREKQDFL